MKSISFRPEFAGEKNGLYLLENSYHFAHHVRAWFDEDVRYSFLVARASLLATSSLTHSHHPLLLLCDTQLAQAKSLLRTLKKDWRFLSILTFIYFQGYNCAVQTEILQPTSDKNQWRWWRWYTCGRCHEAASGRQDRVDQPAAAAAQVYRPEPGRGRRYEGLGSLIVRTDF